MFRSKHTFLLLASALILGCAGSSLSRKSSGGAIPVDTGLGEPKESGSFRVQLLEQVQTDSGKSNQPKIFVSADPNSLKVEGYRHKARYLETEKLSFSNVHLPNSREGMQLPNYFVRLVMENTSAGPAQFMLDANSILLVDSSGNKAGVIAGIHGESLTSVFFNYTGTITLTRSIESSRRPAVSFTMSRDEVGKAGNWEFKFDGTGKCKLTLFFFLPEGSAAKSLMLPNMEPFDLGVLTQNSSEGT